MIHIKHHTTGIVLRTVDADTLRGVDLEGADLTAADLTAAILAGANLAGAKLEGAVFAVVPDPETISKYGSERCCSKDCESTRR